MSEYRLKIVTPDRLVFEGNAERMVARTVDGDVCILARHTDYIVPLAIGQIKVKYDGNFRTASCSGGTLMVANGEAMVIANTFEWSDEINLDRAEKAKEKAEQRIQNHRTDYEMRVAELKLKRALNRLKTGRI